MPISPVNFLWLIDPHDLQGILAKRFGERSFHNVKYYFYNIFRFLASICFAEIRVDRPLDRVLAPG